MIHGIVMDVNGEELVERVSVRVAHHQERAKECAAQLRTGCGDDCTMPLGAIEILATPDRLLPGTICIVGAATR